MSSHPVRVDLEFRPQTRVSVLDVARLARESGGCSFRQRAHALYCSHHTTAGFLDRSTGAGLRAVSELFPPEAGYQHDLLHLRTDLDERQRAVEPRNGDSHLTFIGSGLSNAVTRPNGPDSAVHLVDLDGVNGPTRRLRRATVLGFTREERVETWKVKIPVSQHPVDSVNLRDERLGLFPGLISEVRRLGIEEGRVDIVLADGESHAGLTVNEYETLLMRRDLAEVLADPLRYAARRGRNALADPRAIPGKTSSYLEYDAVRILNHGFEKMGFLGAGFEKLLQRWVARRARATLRYRNAISLVICERDAETPLLEGRYQSPILFQWRAAETAHRRLEVRFVRFR